MPRLSKSLPGPSRLSGILANLNQTPRPLLPNLKSLSLTLTNKDHHFGARHFIKDDLPRIRYANPDLPIHVHKEPKRPEEKEPKAELLLELKDGRIEAIDVTNKWSTDIFEDVMGFAGGERWRRHREERGPTPPSPSRQVETPSNSATDKVGISAALP